MRAMKTFAAAVAVCTGIVQAANSNSELGNIPLRNSYLPTFQTSISFGFNYDLLRSPLDVSFDQPQGYFGFNAPIEWVVNVRSLASALDPQYGKIDDMFNDTSLIRNGRDFKPTAGASQNPNITIRVDMPMLGGVASFSNVQNVYLNYQTLLGNPNLFVNYDTSDASSDISFLLRGTLSVPLKLSMNWETMTFSYAFQFSKLLTGAVSLSRHVFSADLRGKIDADILGQYNVVAKQDGVSSAPISGALDYPSQRIHGTIYGYYDAVAWTPTLALQFWRLSLVSRFGFRTRARGELAATYSVPFFVDPETFKMKYNLGKPETFLNPDFLMGLQTNATDSVAYTTARRSGSGTQQSDLEWRLPTGLTMNFDIIPKHFSVSYTKLFGAIRLKLDRIVKESTTVQGNGTASGKNDSLVLDIGFPVDHVIITHVSLFKAYGNLGIFGLDLQSAGRQHLLSNAMKNVRLGQLAMLPVLNGGTVLGTRWQVPLEIDILPFPALRSGIVYNF